MKFRLKITIFAVIIGVLLIPVYFILQTYGVFQKEKVLSDYALAVDVNGKSYEAWAAHQQFRCHGQGGRQQAVILSGRYESYPIPFSHRLSGV